MMESTSLKHKIFEGYQTWRQERRERKLIDKINHELLELFQSIEKMHPQISDRERFNRLVMQRSGCDEMAAYEVMRIAEESYAAWPQERELTLCDVIHYLAVREFQSMQGEEYWAGGNIAASVKAVVPHKHCPVRLKQPYISERRKASREQ
jgi:hypothetical protein